VAAQRGVDLGLARRRRLLELEKRYVALLACAQALLLTHGVLLIAVNGLSGLALAPDRRLATLPVTSYVLGSAIATVPPRTS